MGMGAAKAVGCRKKFTAVAAAGAGAGTGTEDEAEAEDERSCCPLSAVDIGTSSSPSSLRKGGGRFN